MTAASIRSRKSASLSRSHANAFARSKRPETRNSENGSSEKSRAFCSRTELGRLCEELGLTRGKACGSPASLCSWAVSRGRAGEMPEQLNGAGCGDKQKLQQNIEHSLGSEGAVVGQVRVDRLRSGIKEDEQNTTGKPLQAGAKKAERFFAPLRPEPVNLSGKVDKLRRRRGDGYRKKELDPDHDDRERHP